MPVPADAAAFTLLKEQLVEVLGTLTESNMYSGLLKRPLSDIHRKRTGTDALLQEINRHKTVVTSDSFLSGTDLTAAVGDSAVSFFSARTGISAYG